MATDFIVNGTAASTDAPPATPLLWVLREGLKLTGTKFGCGTGLCGACMVHIDGKRAFSCQTQVSEIGGRSVTTIEGLSLDSSHPLQKAWLAEQVPQCGYCQSGQIMSAAGLWSVWLGCPSRLRLGKAARLSRRRSPPSAPARR
jgi:isoquinoline 1-oxidoreductase alpha subunit